MCFRKKTCIFIFWTHAKSYYPLTYTRTDTTSTKLKKEKNENGTQLERGVYSHSFTHLLRSYFSFPGLSFIFAFRAFILGRKNIVRCDCFILIVDRYRTGNVDDKILLTNGRVYTHTPFWLFMFLFTFLRCCAAYAYRDTNHFNLMKINTCVLLVCVCVCPCIWIKKANNNSNLSPNFVYRRRWMAGVYFFMPRIYVEREREKETGT